MTVTRSNNALPQTPSYLKGGSDVFSNYYVTWGAVAGATNYTLEMSKNGVNGWSGVSTGTNTYLSSGAGMDSWYQGATYYYRVKATNASGNSKYTPVAAIGVMRPIVMGYTDPANNNSPNAVIGYNQLDIAMLDKYYGTDNTSIASNLFFDEIFASDEVDFGELAVNNSQMDISKEYQSLGLALLESLTEDCLSPI